jgi:hypothetical protein
VKAAGTRRTGRRSIDAIASAAGTLRTTAQATRPGRSCALPAISATSAIVVATAPKMAT